jgi:hypothetical protein
VGASSSAMTFPRCPVCAVSSRKLLPAGGGKPTAEQHLNGELYGGWPMILSGLKTWLETGEVLTTPGSLQYG